MSKEMLLDLNQFEYMGVIYFIFREYLNFLRELLHDFAIVINFILGLSINTLRQLLWLLNYRPYFYLCLLPVIFYFVWLFLKKRSHSYKFIAYTRTLFDISLFLLPLAGLFVSLYLIEYINRDNFHDISFTLFNFPCGLLSEQIMVLSALLFIGSCVGTYYGAKRKQFLFFSKKKYILFLRSFGIDPNIENIILSFISEGDETKILKIANPLENTKNSFYIPSEKWKKHVSYYISRAEKVICVIDNTEGVRWEIVNHLEYADKFWYYAYDISVLQDIRSKFPKDTAYNRKMLFCVKNLIEKHISGPITFRIINDKCYYCEGMRFSEFEDSYFIIPPKLTECKKQINNRSPFFYMSADLIRKYLRINKLVLQYSISGAKSILIIIMHVLTGLAAVYGIISSLFLPLSAILEIMIYLDININFLMNIDFFQYMFSEIFPVRENPSAMIIIAKLLILPPVLFVVSLLALTDAIDFFHDDVTALFKDL